MTAASGVGAILGRIAGIETRFAPRPTDGAATGPPPLDGFDPFGEAYARAVAARSAGGPAPVVASIATGASSVSATQFASTGSEALPFRFLAAIAGFAGPPGVRPIGGYGAIRVPAELSAYTNGRIPAAALGRVDQAGADHRLYAPAAASWNNLVEAAAAEGFDLRITDSYRSYEEQVDLVTRKGLYSQGGYAAVPGTSNHGWGLAVDADVTDDRLRTWLQVNAPRFGWVESVPREPWHWEFRPDQV